MGSSGIWSTCERKVRFGKEVSEERLETLRHKRIRNLERNIRKFKDSDPRKADRLRSRLNYTKTDI